MPPRSSSPICERSLDLTLIGIGRRDIPQCSSKHFHMEAFYRTFSGGQRPREWLLRAKEDSDNAQHDLMATPPFVRDALFHCQRVVEKAMKAFLTWHDSAFRKTHNLEELGELCTRIDGSLAPAIEDVTPLTEYAARFRYPGAPWEPPLQEAQESI